MQKSQYDAEGKNWNPTDGRDYVIGSLDSQNAWPEYENLFTGMTTGDKVMLDFGCGPGRSIILYGDRFLQVDGADISAILLDKARMWMEYNNYTKPCNLYETDGVSLSEVPSDVYDVVMSTICLQHICVHEIRYSIMQDIFRVLKPGGWFTAEMSYGTEYPHAVEYYDNFYDAIRTNSGMDTRVTDPNQLKGDLEKIGFKNFSYILTDPQPWEGTIAEKVIFFRAQKPDSV